MHLSVNILYKARPHEPELILCILTFRITTSVKGISVSVVTLLPQKIRGKLSATLKFRVGGLNQHVSAKITRTHELRAC